MNQNRLLKTLIPSIFGLSILTIIWIDFIPFRFNEWWYGSGQKFEKIVYSLSSSYVASYIFYFLLVHLREKNDRKIKRVEFHTHLYLYLNKYHEQLKDILSLQEDIIVKTEIRKPYELPLKSLIHMFEPAPQFSFYSHYSDDETKLFLQNRTKRYRNYFFALKKLIACVKLNHHLLDYYEDNKIYELFHVFIILNEEENLEEQLDHRANTKLANADQYLYEKDIEEIKYFTERIRDEPQYAYALEMHSKEYFDLYYRFKNHLEGNINLLRSYRRMTPDE